MTDTVITMNDVNDIHGKTLDNMAESLKALATKLRAGTLTSSQVGKFLVEIGTLMVEMGTDLARTAS
jgi:hypothetical protein